MSKSTTERDRGSGPPTAENVSKRDLSIDVQPYAPGLLCLTTPIGLLLSADQAGQLVVRLHDAIAKLNQLDAQHQAELAAARKNGQHGRKGIARSKSAR